MKRYRHIRRKLLVCLVLLGLLFSVFLVKAEKKETLRVGLYIEEGYHTIGENGRHSGYDYEYLMKIAEYTGWQYEFVEGTWQECISMLEKGEIDLLGGVRIQEKRRETMCFPSIPSEYMTNCLLVSPETTAYAYEDFERFDGMKIGTLQGSTLHEFLNEYSEKKKFNYTLKWYETEEELKEALADGSVDSVYLSDNRNLEDYKIIARFGYHPLYYALSKERAALADELDHALEQIHTENPYYESRLCQKYFNAPQTIAFTEQERAYIREHRQVEVALLDGIPLICEYDAASDQYTGIIIDVLEKLSKNTGFRFIYKKLPKNVTIGAYLEQNPQTVVAPFYKNGLVDYGDKLDILEPIVQSRMTAVSREGHPLRRERRVLLALPEDMTLFADRLQKLFPRAELLPCETHQAGLDMVKNREADLTLINEITGTYLLLSPYYDRLVAADMDILPEDITAAVSTMCDPSLRSVLNKGIEAFHERDVREIVLDNTVERRYERSAAEWFYQNGLLLLLAALSVCTVLFSVRRLQKKEEQRQQELRIAEERQKADEEYEKKLFRQANFDSLTGLYRKEYFIEKAEKLLAEHPETLYSFFHINIERFRMINEIYGLECGNLVLQRIADKLRESVGSAGVYGRLYSDHFVVCYPIGEEGLRAYGTIAPYYPLCGGQAVRVQLDVGVCINTGRSQEILPLLDCAQIALQEKGGSNANTHLYYYEECYMEHMLENQKITNEMEQALKERQFRVFLQPQFDQETMALVGAEALVRWFHPTDGMRPPGKFIPVFEENRFIYKLDAYIWEEVCRLLAEWNKQGRIVPISVNVSRLNMQNPKFLPMIKELLHKYEVPIRYLHLEITESAYVEDRGNLLEMISALKELGFTIEMDDFGSGYSSLNMLKDLPVDIVKLDMQFFSGETHMDRGGRIIEAIVKTAHSVGMMVIAEGVETKREAQFLQSIQCRIIQGFLYGRPMPICDFEELLAKSEIEEKKAGSLPVDGSANRYWNLEKYNLLLRCDKALVFEYEPERDRAVFTYVGEEDCLEEKTLERYAEQIGGRERIHPDDREKIRRILCGEEAAETLEFFADYYQEGVYERCRAVICRYKKGKNFSRLIAVIKRI